MPRLGLAALLIASSTLAGAQTTPVDERAVADFLGQLQLQVARGDKRAVAAMIHYPLTVYAGGVRIPMANASALVDSFDVVFTPALKAIIAQAAADRARAGRGWRISGNSAVVGPDALHIQLVGGSPKITRIAVPVGAAATEKSAAPSGRAGAARRDSRLALDVGQMQRSGVLAPGQRDVYLLRATKNQQLEVRITGVPGTTVLAHITNSATGAPIDDRARRGVRTWVGRAPDDGEYRLEVVCSPSAPGDLTYVLTVKKGLR